MLIKVNALRYLSPLKAYIYLTLVKRSISFRGKIDTGYFTVLIQLSCKKNIFNGFHPVL